MAKRFREEELEFLKQHSEKFGVKVCAEKLNRPVDTIRRKIHSLGLSVNKCTATQEEINKLVFNSNFVELDIEFSTQKFPKELAYWLGFFWADGYIRKDCEMVIEITEEDGLILEPIFNRLASFSIHKRSREGRKPQMSFCYGNKLIASKLKELGKYSNSIESHEKILNYIPEKYQNYFIRGLIDGDGCFYMNNSHTQFSISSSLNYDWNYLCHYFKEKYNIKPSITKIETNNGNSSRFISSCTKDVCNFISKLYYIKDGIWLNRKYNKAQYILVEKQIN